MKNLIPLGFLFALALTVVSAKQKSHNKKNDWDELEGMLRNIDKVEKVKETVMEPVERTIGIENEDEHGMKSKVERQNAGGQITNPCEDHHCGWGKECLVSSKGKPKCDCIRECPVPLDADPNDMVCSTQNETFTSICHLYRERCLCKKDDVDCQDLRHKNVHLEYLGQCKQLTQCTDELLEQFGERMADWLFQVMRDLKKRQELHGDKWIHMIEEAEHDEHLRHVYPVIWKFCDLDEKPHDKKVTNQELIPETAPVMPMESCIKPFLEKCDADHDEKISIKEWGKCLGLKEEEIIERC